MAGDYYEVLGLSAECTEAEIKAAFRSLAREHHPDANGGDDAAAERYKQISEAYSVLSDPRRRREYDMQRAGGVGGFATTIDDIFDTFFGGGRRGSQQQSRARAGDTIGMRVEIDFRESVFGTERTISLNRNEACGTCSGQGTRPGTHAETCERCHGTGQLQEVRRSILGQVVSAYPCVACGQTGWTIPDPCPDCEGAGRVEKETQVEVRIPPGIETRDQMRVRGEGEAGVAGGPRGDLILQFVVQPDERFARDGQDIVTWLEIPMTTAALGGRLEFESLDGDEHVSIPAGTQSGETFTIRGKGMVNRSGHRRGDLIVRAQVVTPTRLDSEQSDLLHQLAELRGESDTGGRGLLASLKRAFGMQE